MIGILLIFAVGCAIMWVHKHIVIVPSWHFAIVTRYGKVTKILKPGVRFLHPFDRLVSMQTLTKKGNRQNEMDHETITFFPERSTELDPPSISVTTRDGVTVKVDATLWWKIRRPGADIKGDERFELMLMGRDPIGRIYERYKEYVSDALRNITADEMIHNQRSVLSERIRDKFQEMQKESPVSVEEVVIQNLEIPKEYADACNAIALSYKQAVARKQAAEVNLEVEQVNRNVAVAREQARAETGTIASKSRAAALEDMFTILEKHQVPHASWSECLEVQYRLELYPRMDGSKGAVLLGNTGDNSLVKGLGALHVTGHQAMQ